MEIALKHRITVVGLELEDIEKLFDLNNSQIQFKVVDYWKNCNEVAKNITKRTEYDAYKFKSMEEPGWLTVLGDLGEVFLEAVVGNYPSDFEIEPGSFVLAKPGQKGFDGIGKHKSNPTESQVWFQMKFHNPFQQFGETEENGFDSKVGYEIDSFLQSTLVEGQVYRRNNRVLVTTASSLHYGFNERGYTGLFKSIFLKDLDNIVNGGQKYTSKFWLDFKQSLIKAKITKVPPPPPIVLRDDQKEDIGELKTEISNNKNATFISPPGCGKTEVALEITDELIKKEIK
jgi:hypothetical protein